MLRPYVYAAILITCPSPAATLTCERPSVNKGFPRDQVYSVNTTYNGWYGRRSAQPAIQLYSDGPLAYCTPENCTILEISVRDNRGNTYATPTYNSSIGKGIWSSPTYYPSDDFVNLSISVRYRHTPANGTTQSGTATYVYLDATQYPGTTVTGRPSRLAKTDATYVAGVSASYQTPDKHDFNDIAPAGTGTPLVLPAPTKGSLNAKILWNGPTGTTMTRKIGSGSTVNVTPGTTNQLDIGGNSLRLDLNASNTASPGAITGNITLTLTCP